jgi:hypothetical protein
MIQHIDRLRQHPRAGEAFHEIRRAVADCVRVLEPPPDRVYAGPCPGCGYDVLGQPGMTIAQCGRCQYAVNVAEQQAAMRYAIEDKLFTAAQLVSMAKATGNPVSEFTIRSWIRRHQLVAKGRWPRENGEPSPTYRFGDMLRLAANNPRGSKIKDNQVPASDGTLPGHGQPE